MNTFSPLRHKKKNNYGRLNDFKAISQISFMLRTHSVSCTSSFYGDIRLFLFFTYLHLHSFSGLNIILDII